MERNLISLFYEVLSLLKAPPTPNNQERLSFSLEHFLEWLEKEHVSFRNEVLQMGLASDGMLSLFVTEHGLGYVERHFQELKNAARLKVGATKFNATSQSGLVVGDSLSIEELEVGMHYEQDDPIDFLMGELKAMLDETDPDKEPEEMVSLRELGKVLTPELLDVPMPLSFVRCIVDVLYQQVCVDMADDEVETVLRNLLTYRERAQLKPRPPRPETTESQ